MFNQQTTLSYRNLILSVNTFFRFTDKSVPTINGLEALKAIELIYISSNSQLKWYTLNMTYLTDTF